MWLYVLPQICTHTGLVFVLRSKVCKNTNLILLWNKYWLQACCHAPFPCFPITLLCAEVVAKEPGRQTLAHSCQRFGEGEVYGGKTGVQGFKPSYAACSSQKSNQVDSIQLMVPMNLQIFFFPLWPNISQLFSKVYNQMIKSWPWTLLCCSQASLFLTHSKMNT